MYNFYYYYVIIELNNVLNKALLCNILSLYGVLLYRKDKKCKKYFNLKCPCFGVDFLKIHLSFYARAFSFLFYS